MIDAAYCQLMAEYNAWMNGKVYAACASLPQEVLLEDRGAFFKSIYLTLNHIAYSDMAFLSRFTGDPTEVPPLGQDLFGGFAQLRAEREKLDRRLVNWASTLTPEWLALPLTYVSKVDGRDRTVPRWILVTHLFNHQTHHRGQVTTLLSQRSVDVGSTDIPFMPRFSSPTKQDASRHAQHMSTEVEVLRQFFDALNRNDMQAITQDFDPQIVRVEPEGFPTAGTYRGIAAVQEHVRNGRGSWAEGSCNPEKFLVNGDKVVVYLQARVRRKDAVEWSGGRFADGFVFREGKITEYLSFGERSDALKWAGIDSPAAN